MEESKRLSQRIIISPELPRKFASPISRYLQRVQHEIVNLFSETKNDKEHQSLRKSFEFLQHDFLKSNAVGSNWRHLLSSVPSTREFESIQALILDGHRRVSFCALFMGANIVDIGSKQPRKQDLIGVQKYIRNTCK